MPVLALLEFPVVRPDFKPPKDDSERATVDAFVLRTLFTYMSERNLFLIAEIPGFTPQIGRLVSMMNYVRSTTLSAVAGLGVSELDYLHDPQSNSIGALLLHIAAAEVGYQAATFLGRGLDEEEKQEWGAALDLGERARREIRGHELDYYMSRLERVRAKTLAELGRRTDQWLEDRTSSTSGLEANNYFKWFHVFGHEINHRGQIRWLRTRATATAFPAQANNR